MSLCWFCFYFAGGHLTNRCVFSFGEGVGEGVLFLLFTQKFTWINTIEIYGYV